MRLGTLLASWGWILIGAGVGALAQHQGTGGVPMPIPGQAGDWSGALGGGGVGLAGVMFYFYRQDRKSSEEALTKIASEFRGIVEGNTRAITALKTVIEMADNDE